MLRFFDYVVNPANNQSIPGASITVYITGTVTLASLYADNGVTPAPNPVTADSAGRFFFYVANGVYDLLVSATNYIPYTIEAVQIVDLYSANAADAPLIVESINSAKIGFDTQGSGNFTSLQVGGGDVLPSSATVVTRLGTITTTAAASDSLSVTNMTINGHVYWVALNATAAAMTGLNITPSAGSVLLTHPVTAGGIFDIYGSFA